MEPIKRIDFYYLIKVDPIIKGKKKVIKEVSKDKLGLVLEMDGLELDQGQIAAAIC